MAGTMRKRGKKWYFEYMYDGERYYDNIELDIKFDDIKKEKKYAQKYLNRFVIEVEDTISKENKTKMDFDKIAEETMENYVKKELRKNTYSSYNGILKSRLKGYFGKMSITKIESTEIIDFLDIYSSKVKKTTLKKWLTVLSCIFNYAIEPKKYIQINPTINIKVPKGLQKEKFVNAYSYKKINELLDEVKEIYGFGDKYVFLCILAYSGMRRSECLPLLITDIDLDNKKIYIYKGMTQTNENEIIIDKPKSENSIRVIDIPNILVDILRIYMKNLNSDNNRLFNFKPSYITKWFNKTIKKLNKQYQDLLKSQRC